jgi:hypothetical protein
MDRILLGDFVYNPPHPLDPPLLSRRGGILYKEGLAPLLYTLVAQVEKKQGVLEGQPPLFTLKGRRAGIDLSNESGYREGYTEKQI